MTTDIKKAEVLHKFLSQCLLTVALPTPLKPLNLKVNGVPSITGHCIQLWDL